MSTPSPTPSTVLGEALRVLLARRQLTGGQAAENIGITASSFSRILNGVVRPRQGTLTKIIQVLCSSNEEQQMILRGYGAIPDKVEEEPPFPITPPGKVPQSELERVGRYLEIKSMSIDFKKSVNRVLLNAGTVFETDVVSGSVVADFLLPGPPRTAIECKFHVGRDWEREAATAALIIKYMPCTNVLIVVPYINDACVEFAKLSPQHTEVVALADLPARISQLS